MCSVCIAMHFIIYSLRPHRLEQSNFCPLCALIAYEHPLSVCLIGRTSHSMSLVTSYLMMDSVGRSLQWGPAHRLIVCRTSHSMSLVTSCLLLDLRDAPLLRTGCYSSLLSLSVVRTSHSMSLVTSCLMMDPERRPTVAYCLLFVSLIPACLKGAQA